MGIILFLIFAVVLCVYAPYLILANTSWLFLIVVILSYSIIDYTMRKWREKTSGKKLQISIKIINKI